MFSGSATTDAGPHERLLALTSGHTQELKFPPRSAFAVVAERPLCEPSRPPARTHSERTYSRRAATAEGPKLGAFHLRGVIVGSSREVALLEHPARPVYCSLRVEVTFIDGWRVMSIGPLTVILEKSGFQDVLGLEL